MWYWDAIVKRWRFMINDVPTNIFMTEDSRRDFLVHGGAANDNVLARARSESSALEAAHSLYLQDACVC